MDALFVLLIFSVLLGSGFLLAFFWAQKNGQFEDAETPAIRMLFDDKPLANSEQLRVSNAPALVNSEQLRISNAQLLANSEIHPNTKSEKLTVSSEGARNGR